MKHSPSVMLVDDHTMLRQGLRRSLETEGITVIAEASNGDDAVRIALETKPNVILMDVSMPNIDGIEATRRLMAADARQRVVILTMHIDRDVIERAMKAGAVGYMTKDSTVKEVMLAEATTVDEPASILTKREEELLQLIVDGLATSEVAERMFISQKTVKNHLASIYEKLQARDRTQAVLTAMKMGIIKLN